MNKEEFYTSVASILNTQVPYKTPYCGAQNKSRWNNREPGNGRYPGYGIVRMYSDKLICINLYHPVQTKTNVDSPEKALQILEQIIV